MTITATTFALIVTMFLPQSEGLARADVQVLAHGLTAEECMTEMVKRDPEQFGEHSAISCAFDYDF